MDDHMAVVLEPVDSIDDLCLGIRRAYIKHLYNNDVSILNTSRVIMSCYKNSSPTVR